MAEEVVADVTTVRGAGARASRVVGAAGVGAAGAAPAVPQEAVMAVARRAWAAQAAAGLLCCWRQPKAAARRYCSIAALATALALALASSAAEDFLSLAVTT